ncbi:hypothetical protein Vadar_024267 [Vaccinium darrowii]|uniref:Uncharacterized protein n=1 Tax=Vaccinium darrowii TaxID=229202 RepID=A0ACB7YYS9_9ERIC|nr:hypothetical protein Vadar_024267 [Vaccinium darrowii]
MEAATVPPRSPRRKQPEEIQDHPTTTTISELPSHITSYILSRLPLKSIFSCRRVCSSFRNLTSDPYFAQLQLPRSPLCQILYRSSESFSGRPTYLGFVPLHDSLEDLRRPKAPMKFKIPIEIPLCRLWVVSCNGLICLSNHLLPNNVYVGNPLTRQHFRLPKSRNEPIVSINHRYELYVCWSGIGYSRSADLFKVVQFTVNSECERHFSIYTLGVDDEWRTLGDAGLLFPCNTGPIEG